MRDLIVSVAIVAVLIGGWLFFDSYSARSVDEMSDLIYSDLIPAVGAEDWDDSRAMVTELSQAWNEYKKKALFFLNSEELSEIDYCLAKADKYVNAEDVSNSSGELNSLAGQMLFLKTKEKITPENIL